MENLVIAGSNEKFYIPRVNFDSETGICEISGKSLLEETYTFYNRLIDWINDYCQETQKPITVNFKLTYFNTSSSKQISQLLLTLKDYFETGHDVHIRWYIEPGDEDLMNEVEELCDASGVEITFVETDEPLD